MTILRRIPVDIIRRRNANKSLNVISRILSPINFVPQQEVYVIERFGKYDRSREGGVMFKLPIIEQISYVQGNIISKTIM